MKQLDPDRYYDEPYGRGIHCVLLVLVDDELSEAAVRAFQRVSSLTRAVTFWLVPIVTTAQAEAVQALRYPQYRFFHDGNERLHRTGVLDDDELLEALDHCE